MLELTAKLGGQNAAISLGEDATVADLQAALTTAFGLAPGTAMRILNKGKAVKDATSSQLSAVGVSAGTKLMVMASRVEAIKEVEEAKPERMRGFSEDDLRTRTGSSGGSSHVRAASTSSAASPFKFHGLRALPVLPPGAGPPVAAAEARLKELSTDPGILSIMKQHGWHVGRLSEMPPEGLVGVSASCTMGLNKNKGEEILLRLRTDDWCGLRPYANVINVLLHELTHNVHSDHDASFKQLNSELGHEYRQFMGAHGAGRSLAGGAIAESAAPPTDVSDNFGYVLGGGGGEIPGGAAAPRRALSAREAAANAAAMRFAFERPGADEACACGACGECQECGDEVAA